MPVGTSGCTHRFEVLEINCFHCLLQATRKGYIYEVRVGLLSICSQLLPLPLAVLGQLPRNWYISQLLPTGRVAFAS